MKMKAAFLHGPWDLRLTETEVPDLEPNQVRIKIKACGICGSDISCYTGKSTDGKYDIAPYIPGHEIGGDVVAIGKEVRNFKIGDKVTADCSMGCNACTNCKNGLMPTACLNITEMGFRPGSPGGFSEYVTLPEGNVHLIPNDWDYCEAAWVEAFSIGYFSLWGHNGRVDATNNVLVMGAGSVGLSVIMTAKASNALVIAVDPSEYKRRNALKYGADYALDAADPGLKEEIEKLTNGFGPSIVIEASGSAPGLSTAIRVASNGADIKLIGIGSDPVEITSADIVNRNISIIGNAGTMHFMTRTIIFLSRIKNKYDFKALNTKYFDFKDIVEAFNYATINKDNNIKVMVKF